MGIGYIGVLDSGIGGISVLTDLVKELPSERFVYLGDNDNAPYGDKSGRELLSLSINNISMLKQYNLKALVVACNTLSVSVLKEIREFSELEVFGIFPPVENSVMQNNKTLLLATPRTANIYNTLYSNNPYLTIVGLKDLVGDIEENKFNLSKVSFQNHYYNALRDMQALCSINNPTFDTVILGCTHFSFIKNQIFNYFQPPNITYGNANVIKNIKGYIETRNHQKNTGENKILFIGKNAELNEKFYFKWSNFSK